MSENEPSAKRSRTYLEITAAPLLIAASVRGQVTHGRIPGERVSLCNESNVSPLDEPWDVTSGGACRRCVRKYQSAVWAARGHISQKWSTKAGPLAFVRCQIERQAIGTNPMTAFWVAELCRGEGFSLNGTVRAVQVAFPGTERQEIIDGFRNWQDPSAPDPDEGHEERQMGLTRS